MRNLAEEKGFEPLVPFGTAVFKTAALDHSATPPAFLGAEAPSCSPFSYGGRPMSSASVAKPEGRFVAGRERRDFGPVRIVLGAPDPARISEPSGAILRAKGGPGGHLALAAELQT